jgi:nitroreductase
MDVDQTIRGRRSIRRYQDRGIEDPVIEEILDLARHAPSSMNGQPWHFVVVRDEEAKRRLAAIKNRHCPLEKQAYRADFIEQAPLIVVVCVDKRESYDREIENGLLAASHILLAAQEKGLGSVYMSAHKAGEPAVAEDIRQALGIPGHVAPISLVPLGYPDERPEPKAMKPLKEMISRDVFGRR